ncbi:MAG: hypothetical protein HC912_03120 [Saprospiraceae bacterium]|nr:hypothetical protein [Saprospiraceae bacterium]
MTHLLHYLKGNSWIAALSILLIAFSSMATTGVMKSTLYSFKVAQIEQHTHLSWVTLSEEGNQFFTLERSVDDVNFEPIARIALEEEFEVPVSYHYNDLLVKAGVKYAYRLKYINKKGEEVYSSTISILVVNQPIMASANSGIH